MLQLSTDKKKNCESYAGLAFSQKFKRDVFVWFAHRNCNSVPPNQARIARFRVIERRCIENSNKRSDRGALQ